MTEPERIDWNLQEIETAKAKLCVLKQIRQSPRGYKTAGALHFQAAILFLACRFRQHISSLSRNVWSLPWMQKRWCCDCDMDRQASVKITQFNLNSARSPSKVCNVGMADRPFVDAVKRRLEA